MNEELKSPAELKFGGSWKMVIPFFLLPLLIVAGSVGVFYLFGKLTSYQKTPQEYLTEIVSSNSHKRWQAAFELSRYIAQNDKDSIDSSVEPAMIEVYRSSKPDETELRTYLTIALANLGGQSSARLFEETIRNTKNESNQIYALWALGKIASKSSASLVEKKLDSDDPGIRKTAAFSLGFVGDKSHIPALTRLLDDETKDVRWNAALALAELGSAAGKTEILNLLNPNYLKEQTPLLRSDEREEIVISAINAALKINLTQSTKELKHWTVSENTRLKNLSLKALSEFDSKL
ncbi:MAG: HEAT repeat domain-containing protein [Bdellovibrionales bacterium]|nr:HEAT repeat domain-containing protein [Bdellovibrionales bacterium]